MTNSTFTVTPTFASASDANFRTWGSTISAAFAAVGMVQTADTGQINWTTVAIPGMASTDAGYEVWRFDDALQATVPIFFRVVYGTGGVANNRTRVLLHSVGTGSDGAGNLTGAIAYNTNITYGATTDNTARNCYFSSDGSGLAAVLCLDSSYVGSRGVMVIDRLRDADGTPNGAGFIVAAIGGMNSANYAIWSPPTVHTPNGWSPYGGLWPAMIPQGSLSTSSDGTDVHVAPLLAAVPETHNTKMVVVYTLNDDNTYGTQAITHLGASRTYQRIAGNLNSPIAPVSTSVTMATWWAD